MRLTNAFLILGAIACVVFTSLAISELPQNYEQSKATAKQAILWSYILADNENPGYWYSTFETIPLLLRSDWVTGHVSQDIMPDERKKLIHTVGAIAKAKFVWTSNNYTGLFQAAKTVLVRASSAQEPSNGKMIAGVSIKALRDGVPSSNIIAMYELGGQDTLNYFQHVFCTRVAERPDLPFKLQLLGKKFHIQSSFPGSLGTSEFASVNQDGTKVASPNYPWALLFQPNLALSKAMASNSNPIIGSVLSDMLAGNEVLYKVFAIDQPESLIPIYIGYLRLESVFHQSKFSDHTLFFKHTFIEEDFILKPEWKTWFGDSSMKRWETMGSSIYESYMPPWTPPF